jgi:hypothetical protein
VVSVTKRAARWFLRWGRRSGHRNYAAFPSDEGILILGGK